MPFNTAMFVLFNLKHTIAYMAVDIVTQVHHVLRFKGKVETGSKVVVCTYSGLYRATPAFCRRRLVAVAVNAAIVKAMTCFYKGVKLAQASNRIFAGVLQFVRANNIVHNTPANVHIGTVAHTANVVGNVIGIPLGVDAGDNRYTKVPANAHAVVVETTTVKGA